MSEAPKLFDKRAEFFKGYFEKGLDFPAYIGSGTAQQKERWLNHYNLIELDASQKKLINSFIRKLNIVVLSGIWCGDCARQGPMLRRIEEENKNIQIRFVESNSNPELQDELRISGGTRVPVVVALSEDFFEMGRFGDRHLSVYRKKAEVEFGASCDAGILPPQASELSEEVSEWVNYIERIQLMLRLSGFLRNRYKD